MTSGNAPPEMTGSETAQRAVTVSGVVAKRRYWTHKRRPVLFAPVHGGTGYDSAGATAKVDGGHVVESCRAYRMVYLCGAGAGQMVRAMFGRAPAGWQRSALHEHERHPSVTFTADDDGATVRVSAAAVWFGTDEVDPWQACEAWRWVTGRLPSGAMLLATPSTTGRDLMARMLPRDVELPTLAADVADEIRASSTQHRMELVAAGADVPGLVEVDMRLAFAAVVRSLPVGAPVRQVGEPAEYLPYRAARYRATWTVPPRWTGPGLLPTVDGGGWTWPGAPGTKWTGWLDGSELSMARRFGWHVTVHESLLWPVKLHCDPLRTWQETLTEAYLDCDRPAAPAGLTVESAPLAKRVLRSIIIHAIGSLRGSGHTVTRTCAADEAADKVPAGASWWPTDNDTVTWTQRADAAWEEWCRPEWTASIWARTRCRLLDAPGAKVGGTRSPNVGALNLPAGVELVGFRGDALYLTADPVWPDDGAPGRYRVKEQLGPLTVPGRLVDLDELRRRAAAPSNGAAAARAALNKGVTR